MTTSSRVLTSSPVTTSSSVQLTPVACPLYMAIELSTVGWKLAFVDRFGRPPRVRSISAGSFAQLRHEIEAAKKAFQLDAETPVVSCYEAGRDGFWVHRCLTAMGIRNWVMEPSSLQVSRKKRRAKTDRLDAQKIVAALVRFLAGDKWACRMIRIPDAEAEDARYLQRELQTLKIEKTAHVNRLRGLLAAQGIWDVTIDWRLPALLEGAQTADGHPLCPQLKTRLLREFERLALAVEQIRGLQKQQAEWFRQAAERCAACEATERQATERHAEKVARIAHQLAQLGGIGQVSSWTLAAEVFSWRDIQNRRQLGALAGLTPTPHASGSEAKEQGISQSGRGELRALLIEIAWGWLKFQPESELAQWYQRRFADGTSRNRKRGIVALARKLLVALGKFVRGGEVPAGAKLSDEVQVRYTPSLRPRPPRPPGCAAA